MRRLRHLCFLALCAFAAACGSGASGQDQNVTLKFWGLGREGEVVASLIQDFEREFPHIRVQVQQIPWTAAHEKLLTAHVGGSTPDIAQLGNTWIAEFAAIHAIQPLDSLIAQSETISREDYFPGIWNTNLAEGRVYGVPWYVDTRVIFYRSDILRQAGYDSIPQSWAGWLEALRAVKRVVGENRFAIYLPTNEWTQPVVFAQQNGASILRDGGRYGAFREPAYAQAFDFYLALYREGLAPVQGLFDIANPYQEFERGYFAMWITGPWNIGEFKRRLPASLQDRWATAPLPGPTGAASGTSSAGGSSLVVFRRSRNQEAAWQFIEFLNRPEQQVRFYELTGSLPARTEAWQLSELAEDPHGRAFWTQLQRTLALPAVPEIESIMARVIEHSEAAIRGRRTAAQALTALDANVDAVLEKRRWVMNREAQ